MHCIVKKGYLLYTEQTLEDFMHILYTVHVIMQPENNPFEMYILWKFNGQSNKFRRNEIQCGKNKPPRYAAIKSFM